MVEQNNSVWSGFENVFGFCLGIKVTDRVCLNDNFCADDMSFGEVTAIYSDSVPKFGTLGLAITNDEPSVAAALKCLLGYCYYPPTVSCLSISTISIAPFFTIEKPHFTRKSVFLP